MKPSSFKPKPFKSTTRLKFTTDQQPLTTELPPITRPPFITEIPRTSKIKFKTTQRPKSTFHSNINVNSESTERPSTISQTFPTFHQVRRHNFVEKS